MSNIKDKLEETARLYEEMLKDANIPPKVYNAACLLSYIAQLETILPDEFLQDTSRKLLAVAMENYSVEELKQIAPAAKRLIDISHLATKYSGLSS